MTYAANRASPFDHVIWLCLDFGQLTHHYTIQTSHVPCNKSHPPSSSIHPHPGTRSHAALVQQPAQNPPVHLAVLRLRIVRSLRHREFAGARISGGRSCSWGRAGKNPSDSLGRSSCGRACVGRADLRNMEVDHSDQDRWYGKG